MEHRKVITFVVLSVFLAAPVWAAEQAGMQTTPSAQRMESAKQDQLMNMQAKQINGKSVLNARGETLGDVKKIVQNRDNDSLDAVVAVGGFLGLGTKMVTIPIDQLQLQGEKLVWDMAITQDQLKQLPEFQQAQYRDVDETKVLAELAQAPEKQLSFRDLDSNNNGYISPQEAQSDPRLHTNFSQADKNADNRIDQSEFSAFEMAQPEETPAQPESRQPSQSQ